MKEKVEYKLGYVVGRVSGIINVRGRERVALLLSKRILDGEVQDRDVSARLMWVKVSLEGWLGYLALCTFWQGEE